MKYKKLKSAAMGLVTAFVVSACSEEGVSITGNGNAQEMAAQNAAQEQQAGVGSGNIVTTAVQAGDFTILTAALQATGLDQVLADDSRQFTVFAPNDAAFAKLGDETIAALLGDTDALSNILLYHVLADASVDAATAISLAGSTVETANGQDIALSLDSGNLFVNMSQVIATDVAADNGIIHVIDTVLMPPPAEDADAAPGSIVEVAAAAGSFNTLVAALQATGLDATLADLSSTFTVFAPTDDAFSALGNDTIQALLADPDTLSDILLYHVLAGQAVDSTTAISLAGGTVATANGDEIALSLRDGSLFINDSRVVTTDIQAANGVIHIIDAVLTPPAADDTGEQAPTTGGETPAGTILDIAQAAGFSTLVAAIQATGLDGALGHPGDTYTVFAPTDAAFAALGQDTINTLLANPDVLRDILLYHVVPGAVFDSNAVTGLVGIDVQTGNGDTVQINQRGSGLFINDSRISAVDVQATNGIIHVIDTVLIPPTN